MSSNKARYAVVAGVVGLVLWRNTSEDTKQGVFNFLSQIPGAIEEADRRRKLADYQSRNPANVSESFHVLFDDHAVADILADLNWKQNLALTEHPVLISDSEKVRNKPSPDPESDLHKAVPHPSAVLILGKKGSGKSALAYRLLELFRFRADAYAVGLPDTASSLLPDWIGTVDSLKELPLGSTAVVDEAHLRYNSRNSHSHNSRSISEALNLCRQREQTIIVISQEGVCQNSVLRSKLHRPKYTL